MLVAAQVFNIRLMQILGISLAAMAVISVAIFEFVIKDGVHTAMESGHITTLKGEEYDTVLAIESRGASWIGSTFKIEANQQMQIEPLPEGKIRLRFLGTYAGRTDGVKVAISLTDPLNLLKRLDEVDHSEFVLDTLPISLVTPVVPRQQTVFGFGEQPTGYPGPGQELYGLDKYNSEMDTKNIIWRRVAKSPDETLIASVREASVRDVVMVGLVNFAERGDDRAAWTDMLCEALGQVGQEALEMGAGVMLIYSSARGPELTDGAKTDEEQAVEMVRIRVRDVNDLAEAVMICSVAPPSRNIAEIVNESDIVVTGLKELEDEPMARVLAERPLLLIHEAASPSPLFTEGSVIWTGKQNLFPMIRKIVEA
jgi:uncharacterized protein (DUF58 family)